VSASVEPAKSGDESLPSQFMAFNSEASFMGLLKDQLNFRSLFEFPTKQACTIQTAF
jgi:hypothetical protein